MNPGTPPDVETGPSLREKAVGWSRVPSPLEPSVGPARSEELTDVLTPDSLRFLTGLTRRFRPWRDSLLAERRAFYGHLSEGVRPTFLEETAEIRAGTWEVAAPPSDLEDRRVEITGPPGRRTILHALASGAQVFMADFEDAHAPAWTATLRGQELLSEAVRGTLEDTTGADGPLRIGSNPATLMVRPRGWHLDERNLWIDGRPVPAALLDFGLYFVRNARELVRRGSGPYFYLPKIEHAAEARLWEAIFRYSEESADLPIGSIRATVLVETLPAVFEMDEILFELRLHSAGLNLGRWDYIFSVIKSFRGDLSLSLPDRAALTMDTPFLDSAARLLVSTCHRRGAPAIGGMAAQIPVKGDPEENRRAIAQVVADKEREVRLGYDGTWVAHPALVPVALRVIGPVHQRSGPRTTGARPTEVVAADLLSLPRGVATDSGLRTNVRAPLRYLEAWLRGVGAVAIDHRMEDAATVEISRAQLWQWVHSSTALDAGGRVTPLRVREVLREELATLRREIGADAGRSGSVDAAARLVEQLALAPEFPEFFTLVAEPHPSGADGAG